MNEVKSVRRCYACGAIIQSEDPSAKGYVPSDILAQSKEGAPVFCDSCFNERSYNIEPKEASIGDDFLLMLSDARKSNALIIYIVDIFSFESSFISQVSEMIRDLDIVVIANKRDLLPKGIEDDHLKEYVAHRFRVASLPVQKEDVYLASLANNRLLGNADQIKEALERRADRDVYLIGPRQGGKSFFISLFLKTYENRTGRNISTKEYAGTSLSLIDIPLSAHSSIYDTPGTGIDNSLISLKDPSLQKAIAVKKAAEKRSLTLYKDQAICLGGLARLDNLGDKKLKIAAYCSENVDVYRLLVTGKDEKFLKLIKRTQKAGGNFVSKVSPTLESVQTLKDMDVFDFTFGEEKCRDIGIAGLGWFTFESYPGLKLRLYVPKGIGFYGSRSKVGKV